MAQRAPIELKVEYRKLNTFFADYTKNISKGGTFIKTEKPLDIGTEFIFKLCLPVLKSPLELKGVVVWTRRPGEIPLTDTENKDPGMGIKFIYENEQQRRGIEHTVGKIMIDSLGERIFNNLLAPEKK